MFVFYVVSLALFQEKHLVVYVESAVLDDPNVRGNQTFYAIRDKLSTFKEGHDDLTDKVDFIICLGGDGTLLYASSLFQVSFFSPRCDSNDIIIMSFKNLFSNKESERSFDDGFADIRKVAQVRCK